jgi:hypothetical protein
MKRPVVMSSSSSILILFKPFISVDAVQQASPNVAA